MRRVPCVCLVLSHLSFIIRISGRWVPTGEESAAVAIPSAVRFWAYHAFGGAFCGWVSVERSTFYNLFAAAMLALSCAPTLLLCLSSGDFLIEQIMLVIVLPFSGGYWVARAVASAVFANTAEINALQEKCTQLENSNSVSELDVACFRRQREHDALVTNVTKALNNAEAASDRRRRQHKSAASDQRRRQHKSAASTSTPFSRPRDQFVSEPIVFGARALEQTTRGGYVFANGGGMAEPKVSEASVHGGSLFGPGGAMSLFTQDSTPSDRPRALARGPSKHGSIQLGPVPAVPTAPSSSVVRLPTPVASDSPLDSLASGSSLSEVSSLDRDVSLLSETAVTSDD